ncbi:MAG TPA: hypothetical protein VFI91_11535 [Longimicrobiaceae bacterium]|nr:hypothetical protein [Longimicrobiaceae bacterium]
MNSKSQHVQIRVTPRQKAALKRLADAAGQDMSDVRYLLRYLNVSSVDQALAIVTRYFDEEQLPPKSRLALEEILPR